jgi:DNA adenine methylase
MSAQLSFDRDAFESWRMRATAARPFLRWAGGKQPFLSRYSGIFPNFEGKYLEPFLGGGSVFFHMVRQSRRPFDAILSDTNRDLILTYDGIKNSPIDVSRRLNLLVEEFGRSIEPAEYYYRVRERVNSSRPRVDPADFIFINRTCWNGLYRLSKKGKYNVPFGAPRGSISFPNERSLEDVSAALMQATIRATSWENIVSLAEKGDFIFFDPPYVSDVLKDDKKYSARAFGLRDHRRVADALRMLSARGITFILTNSAESVAHEIYDHPELSTRTVSVTRYINSKTELRGSVNELLVFPRWFSFPEEVSE